jgi:RNA polymerase sigma-70 factor, ECF subfamily
MNLNSEREIKQLYDQYHNEIFVYIFIMLGERQQARDLMQETFVKAFVNIENFRGDANPKTWLYRIARNLTIDYQRRKKLSTYMKDYFTLNKVEQRTPEEIIELGESVHLLYQALSKLKKEYRDVIILRKIKELSIKETAAILLWKESRVKTNLRRGLEALREEMIEEGYTSETI